MIANTLSHIAWGALLVGALFAWLGLWIWYFRKSDI